MNTRIGSKTDSSLDPLRSKRFTYFILLLNALVWSITLNIPLNKIGRSADEGVLAAMFIFGPLFLVVWMISIVSYFSLERILKLKRSSLFFLPLIIFAFPVVWTTCTYLYGTVRGFVTEKMHDRTKVETVQLDNTYRNDQYGFEFRYPASWTLNQPDYKGASSVSLDSPDLESTMLFEQGTRTEKGAFIVVSFVETDEQSSEWSLKARMERVRREREPRLKEILIDGKTAIFTQYLTSATVNLGIPIETQNNFLFFDISLFTVNNEEETVRFLDVFERIVSTFKFSSTTASGTSSWQTYSSDQLGFAIQYPSYMNVKESTSEVKIFGRSGICPVFNDLNDFPVDELRAIFRDFPVDELRFIFQRHTGKSFSDIWERVYEFPFDEKAYDGTTLIGGNNAYYFYQGAEMPEGRTAYLVYLGQYEAMQIDAYTLAIDSSNCTPSGLTSSDQKTEDQMLSTIKFMDRGNEGTMGMEQYINAQYGYRVKYPSYLTPNEIDDDLTLSFMSLEGPTENFEGSFSIVVNDTTIEKQVELEKWKASHAIMESVKEKQIVKDGYSGVRLDFVPRPDVGNPRSIVVLHNGKYSYSISAETTHIDQILSTFTLFPFPYFGDTQRTTDIRMLQVALEQYRADRGTYPNTLQDLVPSYVVKLPLDPATQAQYLYLVSTAKLDYSLSAQLDDGTTLTREAPK